MSRSPGDINRGATDGVGLRDGAKGRDGAVGDCLSRLGHGRTSDGIVGGGGDNGGNQGRGSPGNVDGGSANGLGLRYRAKGGDGAINDRLGRLGHGRARNGNSSPASATADARSDGDC